MPATHRSESATMRTCGANRETGSAAVLPPPGTFRSGGALGCSNRLDFLPDYKTPILECRPQSSLPSSDSLLSAFYEVTAIQRAAHRRHRLAAFSPFLLLQCDRE